jgi:hypothetical protein
VVAIATCCERSHVHSGNSQRVSQFKPARGAVTRAPAMEELYRDPHNCRSSFKRESRLLKSLPRGVLTSVPAYTTTWLLGPSVSRWPLLPTTCAAVGGGGGCARGEAP